MLFRQRINDCPKISEILVVAAIPASGTRSAFHNDEFFVIVWTEKLIHSGKFVHGEQSAAIIAVI